MGGGRVDVPCEIGKEKSNSNSVGRGIARHPLFGREGNSKTPSILGRGKGIARHPLFWGGGIARHPLYWGGTS